MNRDRFMKDNRGASLVMVLLAMMFVGIIAAIALAITVGNAKSSKATVNTSKNFYSSESILDDLEMYLKKLATNAATEAYASSLTQLGTGIDVEDYFETAFAQKILDMLNGSGGTGGVISGNAPGNQFNLSLLQAICYDRYDLTSNSSEYTTDPSKIPITITYESIVTEGGYTKIKGLTISLDDGTYESTITTDITFKAKMPSSSSVDSAGEFTYGIDHYVIIAKDDIKSHATNTKITGTYTGSIYAGKNFIVQSGSGESGQLKLKAKDIVIGNDLIVDNVTTGEKGKLVIERVNDSRIIPSSTEAVLYADDIKIYDGDFVGTNLNTYLQGNLEINGDRGSFTASGEDFYGFTSASSGETYKYIPATGTSPQKVDAVKPKSSAIILNGLGAKLDLSGIGTLKLMGTAYTSMSDLKGVKDSYSSYDPEISSSLYYFTQGESVTYRALQALYLIPGNRIAGIGHNPMSVSEYKTATSNETIALTIDSTNIAGLKAGIYKPQIIRHVGSGSGSSTDGQVYIYWDFNSVDSAVTYFTTIIGSGLDSLYFSGHDLSNAKIGMLYEKSGYIKLPSSSSGVITKGNAISYNSTTNELTTRGGGASQDMTEYKNRYANLKGSANNINAAPQNNKTLLDNIFPKVNDGTTEKEWLDTILEPGQNKYDVIGPMGLQVSSGSGVKNQYKDADGNIIEYTLYDKTDDYAQKVARQKYILVTGKDGINWTETFDSYTDTTFLFVSGGDVRIENSCATPVRAMIIAEGDVYLPDGLSLECLGMLNYKAEKTTGGTSLVKDFDAELTEFKALLGMSITGDSEYFLDATTKQPTTNKNGNTMLRKIFDLANTSGSGGSGNGSDFVTIETSEWKRN